MKVKGWTVPMELTTGNGVRAAGSISTPGTSSAATLYLVLGLETLSFAGLASSGKIAVVVLTLFRALLTI